MKKSTKIIILIICFLHICFFTILIYENIIKKTRYSGDYPELYSEAINSILNASGTSPSEWVRGEVKIELWEEDDYSRKLFLYSESSGFHPSGDCYLLVSQYSDEKYVYFYPDYNFISGGEVKYGEYYYNDAIAFSEEQINILKTKNDWGIEIKLDKCIKVEITRAKIYPKTKIKEVQFERLFKKIARETGYKGDDSIHRYDVYCTSDNYGRMLYYAFGIGRDVYGNGVSPDSVDKDFQIVIIFNPDGTCNEDICVMELSDLYNYQDKLKEFKEFNNWNQPL